MIVKGVLEISASHDVVEHCLHELFPGIEKYEKGQKLTHSSLYWRPFSESFLHCKQEKLE